MRCPSCQQAVTESLTACPQCGLSLPALEQMIGIAPTLKPYVTDMAGVLRGSELRGLRRRLARLEHRFPQVRCAVVIGSPPGQISLPLFAFWLFNKGGLTSAVERGGSNRLVMIVLDPDAGKLACMIGYGLEPFVGEGRLTACLQAALAGIASGQTGKGLEACIAELDTHLTEVAASLNQGFGLGVEYESMQQLAEEADAPAFSY